MVTAYINQHSGNTLCQTFHDLALETWATLNQSMVVGLTVGEETITDNNLFVIQSLHPENVAIIKFTRAKESQIGADWDWWLGNPSDGWIKMRVQAKKIDARRLVYKGIDHPNGTKQQINNLISRANADGFFPAYCLYNTNLSPRSSKWGCAIAAADEMLIVLEGSKKRSLVEFAKIQSFTFPWEKLVCEKEADNTLPQRILNQITKVAPNTQSTHDEIFSKSLPGNIETLLKPFFDGELEFIETAGDTVNEPSSKYLAIISDQAIFKNRRSFSSLNDED
ncbi:MAG: hypothetical protein NTW32_26465 [Chloroflexi bacterium]|nr:hypothetical protein [Chloroflexota bacterium]